MSYLRVRLGAETGIDRYAYVPLDPKAVYTDTDLDALAQEAASTAHLSWSWEVIDA